MFFFALGEWTISMKWRKRAKPGGGSGARARGSGFSSFEKPKEEGLVGEQEEEEEYGLIEEKKNSSGVCSLVRRTEEAEDSLFI